nr:glycosyltransferase [Geobacillus zalihae]
MKTSIIILTHNQLDYTKQCIESITKYTKEGSYEIIIVDNHSTDGTVEWLKQQNNIKAIFNNENLGFPKGCNQGIEIATGENILLLNNDTIVTKNWLDNLLACLYSSDDIGAVGPVTNSAAYYSTIPVNYMSIDEMHQFAASYNVSDPDKWEERLKLIGFCMLIKREAVDKVGLLDERFTPGNFEDDDYSVRLRKAGYRLMLCKDTFIHHYGSVSWKKDVNTYGRILSENEKKFKEKWGTDSSSYIIHKELIDQVHFPLDRELNVLQIGCQAGATLLEIKNRFKNARLYGVETNEAELNEAKQLGNIYKNINDVPNIKFDLILFTDDELLLTEELIRRLVSFLKESGIFLGKFLNIGYYKVIQQILSGQQPFIHHVNCYSYVQLETLFKQLNIKWNITGLSTFMNDDDRKFISDFERLYGKNIKSLLEAHYFIVKGEAVNQKLLGLLKQINEKEEFLDELSTLNKYYDFNEIFDLIKLVFERPIEILHKIAIHNFYIGNHDYVIPYLKEAFELDRTNADTIYNIAFVLSAYGEYELAYRYINMLNEEDDSVQKLKEEIKSKLDVWDEKNIVNSIDHNTEDITRKQFYNNLENANTQNEYINERDSIKVSIIIPVYNKLEFTKQCLEGIFRNTNPSLYEIIIVDNASTDGTKAYLNKIASEKITVIKNKSNLGFVEACNQGARVAKGKYLVFLNNDTVPQKNWLKEMIETIESDSCIGIVGAKLIYPTGLLQEAGGIIWSDGTGWNYGRGDIPSRPQYNFVKEVDYCSGACLLIPKELFNRVGGFDRRYSPAYYEDTDLCFSVRALGYKVIYNPRAEVIHYEGITAGTDLSSGMKKYRMINHAKFVDKWRGVLQEHFYPNVSNIHNAAIRNRSRKNILIIDKLLPWYDKASGSLRLFNIIKMLKQLGYFITFIALNGKGQERYVDILERMGIEVYASGSNRMVQSGMELDLNYILSLRFYDVVWLSFYDVAEACLDIIKRISPKSFIIIDTVDIHYLREMRMAEIHDNKDLYERAIQTKNRELNIYSKPDLIITVTSEDSKVLKRENPYFTIVEIPNIHDNLLNTNSYESRKDLLFIGNFNHIPNIDAINYFVGEVWPLVKEKIPDLKFYIVGNRSDEIIKLNDEDIIVTGYVPDTQPFLQSCRVAVVPLRYGAGMKGKIGEAMSSGIPVVTTTIGAEGMNLENGRHVLIADDKYNFAEHIVKLYYDSNLWNTLVENSKKHIQVNYSSEAVMKKLKNLFDNNVFSHEK